MWPGVVLLPRVDLNTLQGASIRVLYGGMDLKARKHPPDCCYHHVYAHLWAELSHWF